jgi:cell pole-organizing protein PopZ
MESMGDLDVFPTAAPAPQPAPIPAAAMWEAEDSLVSAPAASVAASSFAALTGALAMPRDGRTLEDVVRELLRPLMKQWLDENLPRIVETAVQAEVERIARGRP